MKEVSIKFSSFKEVQRFLDRIEKRNNIKDVVLKDCKSYILVTYNVIG